MLIIVGFLLFFFWGKNFSKKIQNLSSKKFLEELKLPKFQEEFKNIFQPSGDDFKKLGEVMKEMEKQQKTNNK